MVKARISTSVGQQTIYLAQKLYLPIAAEKYIEALNFRGRVDGTIHAYREKLLSFLRWCDSRQRDLYHLRRRQGMENIYQQGVLCHCPLSWDVALTLTNSETANP